MLGVQIICNEKLIPEFAAELTRRMEVAVRRVSERLIEDIEQSSPVDTGALSKSMYMRTLEIDGYGEAYDACTALNPKLLPLPPVPTPEDAKAANIGIVADYWFYVEYGTHYHPPQPFVTPAVQRAEETLRARIWDIGSDVVVF
jgi:HK97 gp10 family phage protein